MDNTAFYNRILNNQETAEDVQKFNNMCQDYSDIYKDMYGFRPREEYCMCVNGYSGTPDINKFRELLKQGINPLASVYDTPDDDDEYYYDYIRDDGIDIDDMYATDEEEYEFMNSKVSKEQIIERHPEYEQYFV